MVSELWWRLYASNENPNVSDPFYFISLLKQPRILVFDEATANLDHATAEHFAHTVNKLKGKVTMLFISHQLPKGLHVDEVVTLGQHGAQMTVVVEGKRE